MRHMLRTIGFVIPAVIVGKVVQYAAVGAFGDRLGFAGASLVALVPFVGLLWWWTRRRAAS